MVASKTCLKKKKTAEKHVKLCLVPDLHTIFFICVGRDMCFPPDGG